MVRKSIFQLVFVVCAVALISTGCKTTGGTEDDGSSSSSSSAADSASSRRGVSVEEVGTSTSKLQTVYFDYDRSELRGDAKSVLKANAEAIKGEKWKKITLQGHCDERGSEEYNFALGERRANAMKKYLVALGVKSSRLATVSFGESIPAAPGHTEAAWSKNRRGEFTVK